MLGALASLAVRHPRRMALAALAVFVLAGAFGATAIGLLNARNPFSDPSSASVRAEQLIQRATGAEASPGVLALVSAPPGSPTVTSVARTIARVPGVAAVTAAAAGHEAGLVSADGHSSLVVATLRAAPDPGTVVSNIEAALHGRPGVLLGGGDTAGQQTGKQAQSDLGFAEALAFPLLAILAFFIFRGIAALLPIAVGGMAVLGTFLVLRLVNDAASARHPRPRGLRQRPVRLLDKLRAANRGGDVHLVGGPRTIETFCALRALDKLELVVLPMLFGAGMRLTPSLSPGTGLTFERERALPGGSVEIVYACQGRRDSLPGQPASQRQSRT